MADSSADRDPLDVLAEEFVARFRAGERPPLTEYAARLPDRADEVRDLFPALVELEQLKPNTSDNTGDYTPAANPSDPTQVGEFRILRRVGVGGMGAVYEAIQESLGRHVALKLLPLEAVADPKRLERFRREAKAAARLHHTNIVPVFGTGEADGRHFYAMQFIAGHPLDAVIDEVKRLKDKSATPTPRAVTEVANALVTGKFGKHPFPLEGEGSSATRTYAVADSSDATRLSLTSSPPSDAGPGSSPSLSDGGRAYWATVARLMAQAADALAYAHAQGVTHRDIKPANLLLDLRGTVWVADFGLAKSNDADDLTMAGDVIGTIRYMAPERFDGGGDHRVDVYALGLTLYELLCLRPAFQAPTRAKLVEQVLTASPPKPRSVNPAIPRDLETIVLKAIARDPAARYQNAGELADDLRRYLEDRSILARRATPLEQAVRWCRRNPAVATLAGSLLAVLAIVAVVGTVMSLKLSAALGKTDSALTQVEQERDKLKKAEEDRDAAKQKNAETWRRLLDQANEALDSPRMGDRTKAQSLLKQAASILVNDEVRRLMVRAVVVPDHERVAEWDGWRDDTLAVAFDAGLRKFARMNKRGDLEVGVRTDAGEEVVKRWPARGQPAFSGLHLSPDGRYLAYSRNRTADPNSGGVFGVRDLDTPDGRFVIDNQDAHHMMGCSFHPRNAEVTLTHANGWMSCFSLADGRRVQRVKLAVPAGFVVYEASGERVAAASGGLTPLVNPRTGESRTITLGGGNGGWIGWHPNGRFLAHTDANGRVHILDTKTERDRLQLAGAVVNQQTTPHFTSDGGRVIGLDPTGRVNLWDAHSGRQLLTLPETPVALAAGGSEVVTRVDGKLRLWRLHPGDAVRVLTPHTGGPPEPLTTSGTDRTGRLLAVQGQNTLRVTLFDLSTGEQVAGAPGPSDARFANHIAGGDGWSLSGREGLHHLPLTWPTAAGEAVKVGRPLLKEKYSARFPLGAGASQSGRVVAVPDGDAALVFHADRPGQVVRTGKQANVMNAAVSPDGTVVVTASVGGNGTDPTVNVWDATTGKLVKTLCTAENGGHTARFSPDGRWIALQLTDRWEVWNARTWEKVQDFLNCASLVFSPDGGLVAFATETRVVRLCDTATGKPVADVPGPDNVTYWPWGFSADGGRLIATPPDRSSLVVWDLRKVRGQLKAVGMDWEWRELPSDRAPKGPIRVEVAGEPDSTEGPKTAQTPKPTPQGAKAFTWTPPPLVNDLNALLRMNPETADEYVKRAQIQTRLRQYDRALDDLTKATELDGGLHAGWANRAAEHVRREDWQAAEADAARSLRLLPTCYRCRLRHALACYHLKRYDEAAADFERCEKTVSEVYLPAVLLLRAITLDKGGQPAQAAAVREEAEKVGGKKLWATANDFAWWYATTPAPHDRIPSLALLVAKAVCEATADNPTYLNTLGVAEYRNGLYTEAVVSLEKSLELGKGKYVAHDLYFLAMCHHKLNDKAKEKECFDKAAAWVKENGKTLTPKDLEELTAFRTEAAELLKVK
jgi:serine/threonine protein kinase/WD40 repeat protein/tetratricopeptide (TPR) repeat protein